MVANLELGDIGLLAAQLRSVLLEQVPKVEADEEKKGKAGQAPRNNPLELCMGAADCVWVAEVALAAVVIRLSWQANRGGNG